MTIGGFEITFPVLGYFRLDGGSMFGSVPKALWSRRIAADDENRIPLCTRSLLIRHEDRTFLVDTGMGEKWTEKQRAMYAVENRPAYDWGFEPSEVTDLILTHLHFDHAGGVSRLEPDGLELCYPGARTYLQRANRETALHPNPKERASYLPENIAPLDHAVLVLLDGDAEIYPGIRLHCVHGHTRGQQWVEVNEAGQTLAFPTDLVPTSHHLPLAFHMGYDMCAETLLREKEEFLSWAIESDALVIFEHDGDVATATVMRDERGQFAVREVFSQ